MEQGAVKISLESLGMTLSNVLPRFILNKEEAGPTRKCAPDSLQKSFVFVSDNEDEESGSIVVLGKSSLDEIQAQSLASFEQIHRKSMAMDCKSIISSLTAPEVEKKLIDVLQENLRLKETLEENNLSMKEHLNMLVTKQKELTEVHEAHRVKFAKTKDLVNLLKTENSELRTKLEKLENQEIERNEQGTQTEKEKETPVPETSVQSFENAHSTEMIKLAEKCKQQAQEIGHMNRIIGSLKLQLESLYHDPFSSIKLEDIQAIDQQSSDPCRQHFLASFTHYNEKLQTLASCYAAQTSRYTSVQECLQRCSEILSDKSSPPDSENALRSLDPDKRKELQAHRSRLIDEELKTIAERQEMIKAQNEFQKIFTDYNSTLLELESLRKESERLPTLRSGASLHDERLDEAKASLRESEKLLDDQRRGLEEDRHRLAEQIREVEMESRRLRDERRKLIEANTALNDRERELVEANAALHEEAGSIRESNDVLRVQLKVYESEYEEEVKLRKTILSERNELIDHVRKLEEEKSRYMSRMFSQGHPD